MRQKKEGEERKKKEQASECLFPEGRCKVERIPAPLLCLPLQFGGSSSNNRAPSSGSSPKMIAWLEASGWGQDPLCDIVPTLGWEALPSTGE